MTGQDVAGLLLLVVAVLVLGWLYWPESEEPESLVDWSSITCDSFTIVRHYSGDTSVVIHGE